MPDKQCKLLPFHFHLKFLDWCAASTTLLLTALLWLSNTGSKISTCSLFTSSRPSDKDLGLLHVQKKHVSQHNKSCSPCCAFICGNKKKHFALLLSGATTTAATTVDHEELLCLLLAIETSISKWMRRSWLKNHACLEGLLIALLQVCCAAPLRDQPMLVVVPCDEAYMPSLFFMFALKTAILFTWASNQVASNLCNTACPTFAFHFVLMLPFSFHLCSGLSVAAVNPRAVNCEFLVATYICGLASAWHKNISPPTCPSIVVLGLWISRYCNGSPNAFRMLQILLQSHAQP